VLLVRDGEEARPRTIPRDRLVIRPAEARRIVPIEHVYLTTGFEPGRIYEVIYTTNRRAGDCLGLFGSAAIFVLPADSNGA